MNATKFTNLSQIEPQNNFPNLDLEDKFSSLNLQWPNHNPEEEEQRFSLLARTDSGSEKAIKLCDMLFEKCDGLVKKYPGLISTKSVTIQTERDDCQLSSLMDLCRLSIFKNLNSKTILPILNFAEEKGFPDLTWACIVALCKNKQMREDIFKLNTKTSEVSPASQKFPETEKLEISNKVLNILNAVQEILQSDICEFEINESSTVFYKTIRMKDGFKSINSVCKLFKNFPEKSDGFKIHRLVFSGTDVDRMQELATILPNIDCLAMMNAKIEDINSLQHFFGHNPWQRLGDELNQSEPVPQINAIPQWKNCLIEIDCSKKGKIDLDEELDNIDRGAINCSGWTRLKKLNASHATNINCDGCTALTYLSASSELLNFIKCRGCTGLIKLYVQNIVREIICDGCTALTKLSLKQFEYLNCEGCTALTELDVPCAKYITTNPMDEQREGDHIASTIQFMMAMKPRKIGTSPHWLKNIDPVVLCMGCTALTKLHAPNALEINCEGLIRLKELYAPLAVGIIWDRLARIGTAFHLNPPESEYQLTNLVISNLKSRIKFQYNKTLINLDVSNAEYVNCQFCTALKYLNAKNAKAVRLFGSKALSKVVALKAEEIFCESSELTLLDAPMAEKIFCIKCIALKNLIAPKAVRINCSNSITLTRLEAPNAKEIVCKGCTALTQIDAPKAKEIDCTGCTALTKIDAPNAEKIIWKEGFSALTQINAPNAQIIFK